MVMAESDEVPVEEKHTFWLPGISNVLDITHARFIKKKKKNHSTRCVISISLLFSTVEKKNMQICAEISIYIINYIN